VNVTLPKEGYISASQGYKLIGSVARLDFMKQLTGLQRGVFILFVFFFFFLFFFSMLYNPGGSIVS